MKLCEQFEKETGLKWFVVPVCHGDRGFCSDEYMLWLEKKANGVNAVLADVRALIDAFDVVKHIEDYRLEEAMRKVREHFS